MGFVRCTLVDRRWQGGQDCFYGNVYIEFGRDRRGFYHRFFLYFQNGLTVLLSFYSLLCITSSIIRSFTGVGTPKSFPLRTQYPLMDLISVSILALKSHIIEQVVFAIFAKISLTVVSSLSTRTGPAHQGHAATQAFSQTTFAISVSISLGSQVVRIRSHSGHYSRRRADCKSQAGFGSCIKAWALGEEVEEVFRV